MRYVLQPFQSSAQYRRDFALGHLSGESNSNNAEHEKQLAKNDISINGAGFCNSHTSQSEMTHF